MKHETKQTEIHAQVFEKQSIIVERVPMSNCYNIAHFLKFSCNPTAVPGSLKRRVYSGGTQPFVRGS